MKIGVERVQCGGDTRVVENAALFAALPFDEFNEAVAAALRLEDPGAAACCFDGDTEIVPQCAVGVEPVEGYATSRNEQVRQRISQKTPMAMVVNPVSCPMPRPTRSLIPEARAASTPATIAYADMLTAVPSAKSRR